MHNKHCQIDDLLMPGHKDKPVVQQGRGGTPLKPGGPRTVLMAIAIFNTATKKSKCCKHTSRNLFIPAPAIAKVADINL